MFIDLYYKFKLIQINFRVYKQLYQKAEIIFDFKYH